MRWLKGVLLPALLLCAALGLLVLGFHLRPAPAPAQARDAPALAGRFLKTNRGALDLKRKPAFFFGPHVPLEFFEEIALLPPEKRPHLVALSGTKREIDSLLRRAGLRENYCTCSGASPTDTVPSLVWAKDGRVVCYTCSVALEEIREMKYPLLLAAAEIPNPPGPGGNNAIRAAESIDGAVVGPGEVFSFYEHVGIPSAGRGYLPARSLIETSEGPEWIEDIGGGICRTATVLQFAVEKAGLEVVEKHSHTEPVTYAAPGEDVAVARSSGWDYRFRNNRERPVEVVMNWTEGELKVEIWELKKTEGGDCD